MKVLNKHWQVIWALFLILAVFVGDVFSPLGLSIHSFYFLPVAFSMRQKQASLPLFLASVSSLFCLVGYFLSPSTYDELENIGQYNRLFTVTILWSVTILVRQIIVSRNRIEHQTWLQTGLGQLVEVIRGDQSVSQLAQGALGFLAKYLGAPLGVLYASDLSSKNRSDLKEVAAIGTSRSGLQQTKRPHLSDGLLGRVYQENQFLSLSEVPEHYLNITSGLGNMAPGFIQLAPLRADREVSGIIELGFIHKPEKTALEFLEFCSETLGVALRSAQHKAKLAELLLDSKRQAQALQTQQEELRVTNEELEQQTVALRESQSKLENQQAELEQTNQQLEEQAQILEQQKESLDKQNQDLTKAQEDLKEKALELERSGKYKSEFLANMSHELRTPLNSTLILAKLLSENELGNLTEEQVKHAETIYSSGNDLLNLINDILDLSKVEAGKMEVRPESVPISRIVNSLERSFTPLAQKKNINFSIQVDPEAPSLIVTDRQRLEQILKNFLSNALKFTEKGEVHLKVHPDAQGIGFSVVDTGIGIPKDQQDVIFEAFRQADGTTNRKYGGTGLGLSISRELTRFLGGKISIQSEMGKGSTFTLHLPVELKISQPPSGNTSILGSWSERSSHSSKVLPFMAQLAPQSNQQNKSLHGTKDSFLPQFSFVDDRSHTDTGNKKILIIEDDENFAKILFDLAHEMRFDALVAPTADEGLALAKKYSPTAIALDVLLPDQSGLTVLDQLKTDPKTRHIPVHMLSSEDFSKVALHMGAAGYMLKPVKREKLAKAFSDLEERMSQQIKKVLLVEDDKTQQDSIIKLISDKGTKVVAVNTGQEAIDKLNQDVFDCLIVDLTLPDFSGHELLQKLALSDSPYTYPPVIVYTGKDLSREDEELLRRYSDSIIIKGARSPERLLSEVTLFLHRVESELPPERQKMLRELRGRERSLHGRKILLVDDDVRNIFALRAALEPHGPKIEVARNGKEALSKLEQVPDIDLVLMDIMMPEMDGYEATQKIRAQSKFAKLPIIAVTAKAMRDDQEKSLASGANDYLAKPIDVEKLLSLIHVWMPSVRE